MKELPDLTSRRDEVLRQLDQLRLDVGRGKLDGLLTIAIVDGAVDMRGMGGIESLEQAMACLLMAAQTYQAQTPPAKFVLDEFVVPKDSAVKSIAELKGKRIGCGPGVQNITLASYLRRLLERVTEKGPVPSGATFVVRKEQDLPLIINNFDERDLPPPPQYVVEITTGTFAARHKETVAYGVAGMLVLGSITLASSASRLVTEILT